MIILWKILYNYHWIKYNIIITQLETKLPNSQWQIGKEKILLFSFDCHTELTYKMFNNNKFIKTYVIFNLQTSTHLTYSVIFSSSEIVSSIALLGSPQAGKTVVNLFRDSSK